MNGFDLESKHAQATLLRRYSVSHFLINLLWLTFLLDALVIGSRRVDLSKLAAHAASGDGAGQQQQWIALKRTSGDDASKSAARKPLGEANRQPQVHVHGVSDPSKCDVAPLGDHNQQPQANDASKSNIGTIHNQCNKVGEEPGRNDSVSFPVPGTTPGLTSGSANKENLNVAEGSSEVPPKIESVQSDCCGKVLVTLTPLGSRNEQPRKVRVMKVELLLSRLRVDDLAMSSHRDCQTSIS